MKKALFIKFAVVLPLILLADYIAMALLGCVSCLLGFGDHYFCSTYCVIGKTMLAASALFFGYLVYRDFRRFRKTFKYGKTL